MTVQDIFNLRKEGKTDEAWEAIQPMFAVHKGHYTSLAYFWLASDKLKTAVAAKDASAARRLLFSMTQAYPYIEDKDGRGCQAIIFGSLHMDDLTEQFNLAYFMPYFRKLTKDDWYAQKVDDHWVPSLGQRVVAHLFRKIEDRNNLDYVSSVVPMLRTSLLYHPKDLNNLRILARLYFIAKESEKGEEILRTIIAKYKDSSASYKLSRMAKDPAERIALLCQAIQWQKKEKFRSKMRVELASLLIDKRKSIALYELQLSRATRTSMGNHVPQRALEMERQLAGIEPASSQEEQGFFRRAISYLKTLKH